MWHSWPLVLSLDAVAIRYADKTNFKRWEHKPCRADRHFGFASSQPTLVICARVVKTQDTFNASMHINEK